MIDLGTIKQGERGTLAITWEFPDSLSSPASIVGATITAVAQNMDTGDVTAVSGTLTATAAAAATWALSDGDSGTAGTYLVTFRADVSGTPTYTLNGVLVVEENPAVTAVQNGVLVGLSSAEAAWVTAGKTAVTDGADLVDANDLGTAAYAATGDFDAAGSAAAVLSALDPRLDIIEAAMIPVAPTIAANVDYTTITISWTYTPIAPIAGFKMYRKTGIGGTYALIDSPASGDTSFVDTTVSSDTVYYYKLDAYNTFFSTSSNEQIATTPRSYAQILVDDYGATEVWPLVDMTSGALSDTIPAYVNGNRDGVVKRGALAVQNTAGPVPGTLAPLWDGTNDACDMRTSNGLDGLVDILDFNELAVFVWAKAENAGVWNSGSRWIIRWDFGGSDLIGLYAPGGNILRWIRRQAGVTTQVNLTSMTNTDWFSAGLSASVTNGVWKAFYNGIQQGSDVPGVTTRAVTLSLATLGALDQLATPSQAWQGWIAYLAIGIANG